MEEGNAIDLFYRLYNLDTSTNIDRAKVCTRALFMYSVSLPKWFSTSQVLVYPNSVHINPGLPPSPSLPFLPSCAVLTMCSAARVGAPEYLHERRVAQHLPGALHGRPVADHEDRARSVLGGVGVFACARAS